MCAYSQPSTVIKNSVFEGGSSAYSVMKLLFVQLANVGMCPRIGGNPVAFIINATSWRNGKVGFFSGSFNNLFSDALTVKGIHHPAPADYCAAMVLHARS